VLKAAFAEGRLTQDEYTERVGQVHASRTYADLGALVADLPIGPFGTLAAFPPAPAPAPPAPLPVPFSAPAPVAPVRPARPRRPLSTLEIVGIALFVAFAPTIAIPIAAVSFCVGLSRSAPDNRTRARLAAAAILVVVLSGLALFLHLDP
jgi:uncharacterized protein DUF1707